MGDSELIALLDSIFGRCQPHKHGIERYYRCPNPACGKYKLAINIKKLSWHCWTCGKAGRNLKSLISKYAPEKISSYNALKLSEQPEEINRDELLALPERIELPEGFSLVKGRGRLELSAYDYLLSRLVHPDVIRNRYIGVCKGGRYKNAIIFPSFGSQGYLEYFVARWFERGSKKYLNEEEAKNKIIFNELFIDWSQTIFLVEGIFDMLAISEVETHNVVPLLGSSLSDQGRLLYMLTKHKPNIIVALDADAMKKEDNIVSMLREYNLCANGYNIGRYGVNDPGKMGMAFWKHVPSCREVIGIDLVLEKLNTLR